jgi:ubiquinol-cytochrome c reductase cytochrome b subunit
VPPLLHVCSHYSFRFSPPRQILFWVLLGSLVILRWIGARPVEYPYETIGRIFTFFYFFYFFVAPYCHHIWRKIFNT